MHIFLSNFFTTADKDFLKAYNANEGRNPLLRYLLKTMYIKSSNQLKEIFSGENSYTLRATQFLHF